MPKHTALCLLHPSTPTTTGQYSSVLARPSAAPVELSLALALSGLNHERARHWPAHGGGMETIVLWVGAHEQT